LELVDRPALPAAEVPLAQVRVEHDREIEPQRQDLRRFAGAIQVARVDGVDLLALELLGERARLLASALVERRVRLALDPLLGVPVRLAVADEQDGRGLHPVTVTAWISASAI